jgi:hypothetical protein
LPKMKLPAAFGSSDEKNSTHNVANVSRSTSIAP